MKKALKTAARGTVFPYAGEKWVALADEIRQQDYAMAMMDGSRKTMIGRAAAGELDANQREGYSAELAERRLRESFKRRGKKTVAKPNSQEPPAQPGRRKECSA